MESCVGASAKLAVSETCQSDPTVVPDNTSSGYAFLASTYVADVQIGGTCLAPTVTITTQATGAATDPVLELTGSYADESGRIAWDCVATSGLPQHVPSTCRS